MRLGGPIFKAVEGPESWAGAVREAGYRSCVAPVNADMSDADVSAYAEAAGKADLVIAEVGAWSNPMSADETTRKKAIEYCGRQLDLADRVGANCCVNIAGSRGEQWDGHHPENLTQAGFDAVVETTRAIVDSVNPTRTFYTLETMPWMFPDSAETYLQILKAVDRKGFAAHLDPVNIVVCPRVYYDTGALLRECFAKLGPYIKSCHAKDIILRQSLTVHLDEVGAGLGNLDYGTYLTEAAKLSPDMPLILEHLSTEEEYARAAEHVRSVAKEVSVEV